ncbi:MAG: hypothetical protein GEU95_01015 [Rhizobiales bacterium]|nr:hypothetical protein [Hyphomicrobiales bacterium]
MSIRDDFLAERQGDIERAAAQPGAEGAFGRLMLKLDPAPVGDWLDDERDRGTDGTDVAQALANYMANAVGPFIVGRSPQEVTRLFGMGCSSAMALVLGVVDVEIFAQDSKTGAQSLMTAAGIAKDRMSK